MTMRRLKNISITPPEPEHFTFVHPETGVHTKHMQHVHWVDEAIKHRLAMNLPISASFVAEMEDQLCSKLSPEWCHYEKDGKQTWTNTRLSLSDVIGFTKVLLAHARNGELVSQDEANRRAKICASCHFNVVVSGCGACHALTSLLADGHSTKYDSQLQSCGVCKCFLRSAVHFPLAVLEANDTNDKQEAYPSFCWKKISGENYHPD